VEKRRRIGAYGVIERDGRVLLVRSSARSNTPGVWSLPGGGIDHGEDPAAAVVREVAEETGLDVRINRVRAAVSDVTEMPWRNVALHHDRIVYDLAVTGGDLRDEPDGTSDIAAWFTRQELAGQPVMPFTAELLDVPSASATFDGVLPKVPDTAGEMSAGGVALTDADGRPRQVRRFGAYALATDPAGRVLLTLISDNYPGSGRWHLPGGGTDYGEQPVAGMLRELAEETGQVGRVVELLEVSTLHEPDARGPEGHPIDWQGVRVLYRVAVDAPTEPKVIEVGSTAAAAWYSPEDAARLRLTDLTAAALRHLT
jgi:8-oxo-dGTP diphosphatase